MFIKIGKNRGRCKAVMHAKSTGGIMLAEYHCVLPNDHEGNHVGGGLTWNNSNKFLDNLHKAGDRPNRPLVFLGKT